ncbi:hypothetical protein IFR05_014838 [Cadophora sp. M221]|nr:hypothetical protein IFR05_014838 [Cadophora sp. M221]
MEYVQGQTLKELLDQDILHDLYFNQISKAMKLFLSFEVPDNATPGPIGGGTIRHFFFKDTVALIEYSSVDALQYHVQALANMPATNGLKVNFENEDLCFYYSNFFEGNFIFTNKGDFYIVDFEHAGVLPARFITYALDQPRPACTAIKKEFTFLPYENLEAMRVAGHNFMIRWRKAATAAITITVDSAQSGNPGSNAVDLNNGTIWHSQYSPSTASLPHTATLNLGACIRINGFTYLPRQDVKPGGFVNGNIGQHNIQISTDNTQWTTVVSNGVFADTAVLKKETFSDVLACYVRITALTEAGNRGPWTSAAEFGVIVSNNAASSTLASSSTIPLTTSTRTTTPSSTGALYTVSASVSAITVDSFQSGNEGSKAIDGDQSTIWHSRYDPAQALPHNAVMDLGSAMRVTGVTYLPRQDVPAGGQIYGNIGQHTIETSMDNTNWARAATSTFVDDAALKKETFPDVTARYVRITALTEAGNRGPWSSAAELGVLVLSDKAPVVPPSRGSWGSVIQLPLVAAGAFVLPDSGKVLVFSASGNVDFDARGKTMTAVYNPANGAVSPRTVTETKHDMFCPGISLDTNGRAIVTGGNDDNKMSIYSAANDGWTVGAPMNLVRGYQSSATLSDGRIFTIGGSWVPEGSRGGKDGEIYSVSSNTWTRLPGCPVAPMLTNDAAGVFRSDNHGWLFGWKNGAVFQAGPSKAMNWYGTSGTGSRTAAGTRASDGDSMNGNAVMYDSVNGKIFTAGGSPSYDNSYATSNVHKITIGAPGTAPSVTRLTSMSFARAFANSVPLADGKIFVTGGQTYAVPFSDANAIMQPELWDPATEKFTVLPSHKIPRTYHSIALLMLDGRVFTGGGGICGGCSTNHLDAEIYSPGYLFNPDGTAATRPVLNSVSVASVAVGGSITVTTDSPVTRFSLIRYGSVTHTVNTDQRVILLTPTGTGSGNSYTLTIPGDSGIALPGYWMLFAVNAAGVPSIAKSIKVTM